MARWQLTDKQMIAWERLNDDFTNEIVFGGGAGGAKSFLGCAWLIRMATKYPETRWLMGRKKLKRLKETTLMTFFEVCKSWGYLKDVHYIYYSDSHIRFRNGSEIYLKDLAHQPSDPNYDDLGSLELTGAFIDEVSQITHQCWQVVNTRIRYKLDQYGLVPKCLGTCNPSKGWVYTNFYKPEKEGKIQKNMCFIQALVQDNPFISDHYIKQLNNIKDKATKERLLFGNWEYDDDPACLFDLDTIQDLFTNKAKEDNIKYISGDVSRKGGDKMPVGLWQGLQLKKVFVLPYEIRKDTEKSAKYIRELMIKEGVRKSYVVLDEDGVGGGVVDKLGCRGFVNGSSAILSREEIMRRKRGERATDFGNLKTQCFFKLAELAEAGLIGIDERAFESSDDKEDFIEELGQIKQKDLDKDGRVFLIGKDKIKENIGRSPDFADMVMMRMYFEVKPRVVPGIITIDY